MSKSSFLYYRYLLVYRYFLFCKCLAVFVDFYIIILYDILMRNYERLERLDRSFNDIILNASGSYYLKVDLTPSNTELLLSELSNVIQGIQSQVSQQFQAIRTFLRRMTRGPLQQGTRSASSSSPFGNQLHFLFVTLHLTNFGDARSST